MIVVTSVEAQSRFGELIDRAQREPVAITRRGRPVAYVVSEHDLRAFGDLRRRRKRRCGGTRAIGAPRAPPEAAGLTDGRSTDSSMSFARWVVLDTGVLVSAAIRPDSVPALASEKALLNLMGASAETPSRS